MMETPGEPEVRRVFEGEAPSDVEAVVVGASASFASGRKARALPSPEALREASARALFCPFPTRFGPLHPTLQRLHDALEPGGLLVVSDLVWQTAPSQELAVAFRPAPPAERVRPIEGYEMQLEHFGFAIARRVDLAPAAWHAHFAGEPAKHAALAKDERGAARVSAWALVRAA